MILEKILAVSSGFSAFSHALYSEAEVFRFSQGRPKITMILAISIDALIRENFSVALDKKISPGFVGIKSDMT